MLRYSRPHKYAPFWPPLLSCRTFHGVALTNMWCFVSLGGWVGGQLEEERGHCLPCFHCSQRFISRELFLADIRLFGSSIPADSHAGVEVFLFRVSCSGKQGGGNAPLCARAAEARSLQGGWFVFPPQVRPDHVKVLAQECVLVTDAHCTGGLTVHLFLRWLKSWNVLRASSMNASPRCLTILCDPRLLVPPTS